MNVSGMSGNEIYCLGLKGLDPSELVVGNSVVSLGVIGGLGASITGVTGGEITAMTQLISDGRHKAIDRMVAEAEKHGAVGVTSVVSDLRTLSGYNEFLAQGTAVTGKNPSDRVFTTAASGMELYCHLDAGYRPMRFAMGNVAYALGIGQGLTGSLRTMARGEVKEFSAMYNHIRHLALTRLQQEAFGAGANAVVDVKVKMLPFGVATELLMTGTASHHPLRGTPRSAEDVVTSELTGEELWNLASMGYVPVQLVMATSIVSLGVVGGIGSALKGMTRGEIPELTHLVYEARANCIDILRKEAERVGGERVIGNRLMIREISAGLIEVIALGTAVKRMEGMKPETPTLIPQAIIVDDSSNEMGGALRGTGNVEAVAMSRARAAPQQIQGCIALIIVAMVMFGGGCMGILSSMSGHHH
jgi:uncharacterized protein YbjQ (UPF0145 family)